MYLARAKVLFVYSPGVKASEKPPVDMKETYRWLKSSNLSAATEGLVVAAQDQALRTRYYECNILHQYVSPTCRWCSAGLETVDNIVAGCSALAPMDYTNRHDQVASIIHWDICRQFGVPVESRWYRHHLDRLVETDDITMMWDTAIPPVKKIGANRPDKHLSSFCNITRKQAEKLVKYSGMAMSDTGCQWCWIRWTQCMQV